MKVIDLELGKQLVDGDENTAKELLKMLADSLPTHQQIIHQAAKDQAIKDIISEAHKLHGATCYTGTPRIKAAAKELELAAKANQLESLPALIENLDKEIMDFNQSLKEINS